MRRSIFLGTGSALPKARVTNADLAARGVETSDDWITQRTGIKQRYIADDHESTVTLATDAARKALEAAKLAPSDIHAVIVATTTPDNTFPSVAVQVQSALGIPACTAFDVQAVCTGFVYAMTVADLFITSGKAKNVLVIGAEVMSRLLDWEDRTTCVLFGDGAGAAILGAAEGQGTKADRGILSTHTYGDGQYKELLYTKGGPGTTGKAGFIHMEGREVFKNAVTLMHDIVAEVLETNGLAPSEIDWLVPHQANIRIIQGTADKLAMSMDKVVVTVDQHGNTSAASIPLALDWAVREGKIKAGDMLLFEALGGGLTWGAVCARF
ncbi:MAG: beta-ketoacyl-ACP synthase III [Pseudobdellovibrionaceae bacterium]